MQRALVGLWLPEARHKKSRDEGACSRWDGPTLRAKPPQKAWRFFPENRTKIESEPGSSPYLAFAPLMSLMIFWEIASTCSLVIADMTPSHADDDVSYVRVPISRPDFKSE